LRALALHLVYLLNPFEQLGFVKTQLRVVPLAAYHDALLKHSVLVALNPAIKWVWVSRLAGIFLSLFLDLF